MAYSGYLVMFTASFLIFFQGSAESVLNTWEEDADDNPEEKEIRNVSTCTAAKNFIKVSNDMKKYLKKVLLMCK
jgi:hypothetical protein